MSFLDNLKETTKNLGGKMAETASDLKEKASDKIEIEKLKHQLYMTEMERDLLKKLNELEREELFRK